MSWTIHGTDEACNAIAKADEREAVFARTRFSWFGRRVWQENQHPCHVDGTIHMKLMEDGDALMMYLTKEWWVPYRVRPNCGAQHGQIVFGLPYTPAPLPGLP